MTWVTLWGHAALSQDGRTHMAFHQAQQHPRHPRKKKHWCPALPRGPSETSEWQSHHHRRRVNPMSSPICFTSLKHSVGCLEDEVTFTRSCNILRYTTLVMNPMTCIALSYTSHLLLFLPSGSGGGVWPFTPSLGYEPTPNFLS